MGASLNQFFANPLFYIGAGFSVIAALLIIMVVWGGIIFAFARQNATERSQGNTLALWGIILLIFFFILWEIIRSIAHVTV